MPALVLLFLSCIAQWFFLSNDPLELDIKGDIVSYLFYSRPGFSILPLYTRYPYTEEVSEGV
jgi:hypothetical protein